MTTSDDDDLLNLFFMGNSYTAYNGLAELAKQALKSLEISSHVQSHHPGGESFGGHLKNLLDRKHGLYRNILEDNDKSIPWDWILLQNQSQIPGFVHDHPDHFQGSVEQAQQLVAAIQERHPQAKFLFVMTWGRRTNDRHNPAVFPDFLTMQQKLTAGYLAYAAQTTTTSPTTQQPTSYVAPVGLVFETIYKDDVAKGHDDPGKEPGSLFHSLYSRDGSHPSLAGSYVSAMTIIATLVEVDVQDMDWAPSNLDPQVARQLREAVSRTIRESADNQIIRYPWQQEQEQKE